MAISKVILNGEVLMDVTQKTVEADRMLYGTTALRNDGTDVVGDIAEKTGADLTASGATVTVPAGFYSAQASKSVGNGSVSVPATTITAAPGINVDSTTGEITAVVSGSKNISPTVSAGYVTTGTAGTVTVEGSNTEQLSTQAGKTVTPTETAQVAVAAGKYTLGAVNVGAISKTYVGSNIARRDSDDLTSSGATVNVPAGYYASAASVSVPEGSAATPATTITANPTISVSSTGLITATVSGSESVTPSVDAGYVDSGTAGTVSVTGTKTQQLTTKAAATYTPSEETQTIAAGQYLTGKQTISAIPSDYVGSDITRRSSSSLTVSGATVTVPAGYYASQVTKSVASGSATTPTTSITANPTVEIDPETGIIMATTSASKSITPTVSAGYVSSGTAGTVSVSGSKETQMETQAGTTITPTESAQTAVSAGKYTLGDVKVGAVSSTYVGSEITRRSSTDLTASGATVTVPAGYYSSQASKAIASGSMSVQDTISGTSATVTTGTNTLTLKKTISITPAVTAGYISKGTATNSEVSLTASVATKSAAIITPGTSNQTIAAGTYLTGAQTISGDENLTAQNIANGVQIFGITGSYVGSYPFATGVRF